ncbi:Erg28-like protein [Acaromyces ingoldii]|uniref:Erg28-like protein n=1 Tax=Acaromyces ingoldii TaxID=215250 RepID=A0A316YNJ3_9BASI|nr:Erg28-like protein [Acaromyces ingoldii]PWN90606.1 Erg28-like protein [Acaromyces ingoldii]
MTLLPPGYLPKWLLLVGLTAIGNAGACHLSTASSKKVYITGGAQVTPLASRLFGVWNLTSGALRVVCAYNMSNPALFYICQMTFATVLLHLLLEIFIYKTTSLNAPGVLSPILVATTSLTAMSLQHRSYLS